MHQVGYIVRKYRQKEIVTERLDNQSNGKKSENLGKEGNHGKVCYLVKGTQVFLQSVCYVCPFLNRTEIRRQNLVKFSHVNFFGSSSAGIRNVPFGQKEGH